MSLSDEGRLVALPERKRTVSTVDDIIDHKREEGGEGTTDSPQPNSRRDADGNAAVGRAMNLPHDAIRTVVAEEMAVLLGTTKKSTPILLQLAENNAGSSLFVRALRGETLTDTSIAAQAMNTRQQDGVRPPASSNQSTPSGDNARGARTKRQSTSVGAMTFEEANAWQRECLQLGSEGYDGFMLLVGLFLVLLIENLWSFDGTQFSSKAVGEAFLALLAAGAAFGLFTIFSVTTVKLKTHRLLTRDLFALRVYEASVNDVDRRDIYLDRIIRRWEESTDRRETPACICFEWYQGANFKRKRIWDPRRPRSLVYFSAISFVAMIVASIAALAVQLADTQSVAWSVYACVTIGGAVLLPAIFINISLRDPPELRSFEQNPFRGLA